MQTPHVNLGSETLRQLGRWHLNALDQFEETRSLMERFQPVQNDLVTVMARVQTAVDALLSPRTAGKLAEMAVEKTLRRIDGGSRTIDGKQHGPTSKALMPKGLTGAIQPVGQRQVDEANALLQRAAERGLADNATLAPLLTELRTNATRLQTALDGRTEAYGVVANARTAEMMCREDFCTAYSREMGLVRATYPDDRTMQEFFFDTFKKSGKNTVEEAGGAGEDGS